MSRSRKGLDLVPPGSRRSRSHHHPVRSSGLIVLIRVRVVILAVTQIRTDSQRHSLSSRRASAAQARDHHVDRRLDHRFDRRFQIGPVVKASGPGPGSLRVAMTAIAVVRVHTVIKGVVISLHPIVIGLIERRLVESSSGFAFVIDHDTHPAASCCPSISDG